MELFALWEAAHAISGAGDGSGTITDETLRLSMLLPMTIGDRAWLEALRNRKPTQAARLEHHMPEWRDEALADAVASQFGADNMAEWAANNGYEA